MAYLSSISSRIRSTLSGQDGIALLMVLVVITILTTLVVSFTDTTQKHLKVTQYYKNKLQAYWAAQSGIQAAVAMLRMTAVQGAPNFDGATSAWHFESDAYQEVVPIMLANILCESSTIEPALLLNDPRRGGTDLNLGRYPEAAPILDENRKLSLFHLINGQGTPQEQTNDARFYLLQYLLQFLLYESDFTQEEEQEAGFSLGIEEETRITIDQAYDLAGYLVDWMDTDNNQSTEFNPETAEQSCPADGLPYEAKNGRLDSASEIGLVCGFRQLPSSTIELLTRHLTAYNLETNINTATLPVLHALCAAPPEGDGVNEEFSQQVLELLHYDSEDTVPTVIENATDYDNPLADAGLGSGLIGQLEDNTGIQSSYFQIAVYGVVTNMNTMTDLARSRLQMDLQRDGQNLILHYYRED